MYQDFFNLSQSTSKIQLILPNKKEWYIENEHFKDSITLTTSPDCYSYSAVTLQRFCGGISYLLLAFIAWVEGKWKQPCAKGFDDQHFLFLHVSLMNTSCVLSCMHCQPVKTNNPPSPNPITYPRPAPPLKKTTNNTCS